MLEAAAFLLLRVVSVAVCAWVLWVLLWMALDVVAVARAAVSSARRGLAWAKAEARVTASHPDTDLRNARISVVFDLPGGGSAAAMLPASPPILVAGSERGPQVFPRTMGKCLLSLVAERPIGARVAIVFDPADPRRVEHGMGITYGAIELASRAVSLIMVGTFGLGMVAILLGYVIFR